jgi:vacuolar-type H+-ATPase subunit I/STV1
MALEKRNGNYYYYKKEREGKRVVSKYYGKGGLSSVIAQLNELDAARKEYERFEEQQRREKAEKFEREIAEIENAFNELITAHLLINGYHQTSSREWRKIRNGRK